MIVQGFTGPSNRLISLQADADETINFFLEKTAPGTAKSPDYLRKRPGLRPFYTLPTTPVRGLFEMNGRAWAVAGAFIYELFGDGTFSAGQAVADREGIPVSMVSNGSAGHQLFIVSADLGYIWDLDTDVVTQITADGFPFPARVGEFMDGYFLALQGGGSRQFNWSALEDGTSWDALDVAQRSEAPDNLASLIRSHREIWLMGGQTSEVWVDTGDPTGIFQPLQGVFLEMGCFSPWGITRVDNSVIWVGSSVTGSLGVYRADGYTPKKISTTAMDFALGNADSPTDIRVWSFRQNGHEFAMIVPPREPYAYVYQLDNDRWYKWGHWDSTACVWLAFRGQNCCQAFSKLLVGDRLSGTVYDMSEQYYDDELAAVA